MATGRIVVTPKRPVRYRCRWASSRLLLLVRCGRLGHVRLDARSRDEKLKAGTKYERLAATVFHMLTKDTALHDLRLRGEVGVPHQIDAVVGDEYKRILIEAKDYDKNVDLPIVRDFSAVVDDLGPDEAFVVTTVGFSRNAVAWAKAKGLKLAIMRVPEGDEDWGNLVQRVSFELRMSTPSEPRMEWFVDASEAERFADGQNPIGRRAIEEVFTGDAEGSLAPFGADLQRQIDAEYRKLKLGEPGELTGGHEYEEPTWLHVLGEAPIRVKGYKWIATVSVATRSFSTGFGVGGLAAELVLRTMDGSIHRIFTNKQIQAWTFDGKRVVSRNE